MEILILMFCLTNASKTVKLNLFVLTLRIACHISASFLTEGIKNNRFF